MNPATRYYNADAVDAILKQASDIILNFGETIKSLDAENTTLKAAATKRIELEKVANEKRNFAKERIHKFVDFLASRAIIRNDLREKYAAVCLEDPNNVFAIAETAIKSAEPQFSSGSGVDKTAANKQASLAESEKRDLEIMLNGIANPDAFRRG